MILQFGAGDVFARGITDIQGNRLVVATPVRIMGLQEFSLDIQTEIKEFHGQGRFPIATAQGKSKISGKIKGALINGATLNGLIFGQTMAAGTMKAIHADEAGLLIPTATPFTITPRIPNSGRFADDLGVVDEQGRNMVKVSSNPLSGQYAVSAAGVYTFAELDKGKKVFISFAYTYVTLDAKKIPLTNAAMGENATFELFYIGKYKGKRTMVQLASVTAGKLSLFGSKNDDFSVPELDFSASADDTGFYVGDIYVQE